MSSVDNPLELYLNELPEERRTAIIKLRNTIKDHLPEGFVETISNGMISYVVPHSIYPKGYHCNPKDPLPFISLASQKNYIALYHMGLYVNTELLNWFVDTYQKQVKSKLDMGKSCIRFKKIDQIPYLVIGELCQKISVDQWIRLYTTLLLDK